MISKNKLFEVISIPIKTQKEFNKFLAENSQFKGGRDMNITCKCGYKFEVSVENNNKYLGYKKTPKKDDAIRYGVFTQDIYYYTLCPKCMTKIIVDENK